jgi:rod shape-determining protein MreD
MKYLFLAVSSFLAIVAQMIAGNNFFLFNFLDLSLILIAYWAIYRSRTEALFVGSLTGILLDAAFGWPLGYNGFSKTLAAFAIGQAAKRFNVDGFGVRFALITAASFLSSLTVSGLFSLLQNLTSNLYLEASLIQSLITGLVGVLMLSLLDGYQKAQANRAG